VLTLTWPLVHSTAIIAPCPPTPPAAQSRRVGQMGTDTCFISSCLMLTINAWEERMAELREDAAVRLRSFGQMTLNEIAIAAAREPGSTLAQMAEVEIRRRVADAQIEAANAQREAAGPQKITAWATVILAAATLTLAIVTFSYQMTR
jgi:hypothetical protein